MSPTKAKNAARYLTAAKEAGCPKDLLENLHQAGVILQPKQLHAAALARLCDKPDGPTEIGYGGARGGGKTAWVIVQLGVDDCQRHPGLKCLFLRRVGRLAKESLDDQRQNLLRKIKHDFSHKGVISFPNGSRIITGHFNNEKDIDQYLGMEYDVIAIEEATTLTSNKYRIIQSACRTSKPGWRPRMYSTSNPGGVGHGWYKSRFILPYRDKKEVETRFIPAVVTDNRMNNREYVSVLDSYSGWLKKAWRFGDWDIAAGQFFTNYNHDLHVKNQIDGKLAKSWFCGLDYGFTHYTSVHLGFWDGDGNAFIVDEHAERKWLVPRHAAAIKSMLGRHQLTLDRLDYFVAGADVFAKRFDGLSIAEEYEASGIRMKPADMDRINGAAVILKLLGDPDNGQPVKLRIHERCRRLIECLPYLQHDPNRPEDVLKVDMDEDGSGGDDCFIAGTMIRTAEGERPIETIKAGDMVMTRDGARPVANAWLNKGGKLCRTLTVTFADGRTLTGTPTHRVWVSGSGWTRLDELIGKSVAASGGLIFVPVVRIEEGPTAVTYAIHVRGKHEYFANGFLAENCYDSARYGLFYKHRPVKMQKIGGF